MSQPITIEIIGPADGECGPFPCDDDRTCGLVECHPTGRLVRAYPALEEALSDRYGSDVEVTLTLIENGIPDHVREIIEEHHPPLPIVLVAGALTPIGRVSLPLISAEIDRARSDQQSRSS
ncbi:MAG: hypothetical protein ACP5C4_02000 [Methanomicrobiales archaeon]